MSNKESELQYYSRKLPAPLRNKYAVVGVFFILWMIFFDRNNIISQLRLRNAKAGLKEKIEFHKKALADTDIRSKEIFTDNASIEKFAREQYLFKRENEEVYVVDTKK